MLHRFAGWLDRGGAGEVVRMFDRVVGEYFKCGVFCSHKYFQAESHILSQVHFPAEIHILPYSYLCLIQSMVSELQSFLYFGVVP